MATDNDVLYIRTWGLRLLTEKFQIMCMEFGLDAERMNFLSPVDAEELLANCFQMNDYIMKVHRIEQGDDPYPMKPESLSANAFGSLVSQQNMQNFQMMTAAGGIPDSLTTTVVNMASMAETTVNPQSSQRADTIRGVQLQSLSQINNFPSQGTVTQWKQSMPDTQQQNTSVSQNQINNQSLDKFGSRAQPNAPASFYPELAAIFQQPMAPQGISSVGMQGTSATSTTNLQWQQNQAHEQLNTAKPHTTSHANQISHPHLFTQQPLPQSCPHSMQSTLDENFLSTIPVSSGPQLSQLSQAGVQSTDSRNFSAGKLRSMLPSRPVSSLPAAGTTQTQTVQRARAADSTGNYVDTVLEPLQPIIHSSDSRNLTAGKVGSASPIRSNESVSMARTLKNRSHHSADTRIPSRRSLVAEPRTPSRRSLVAEPRTPTRGSLSASMVGSTSFAGPSELMLGTRAPQTEIQPADLVNSRVGFGAFLPSGTVQQHWQARIQSTDSITRSAVKADSSLLVGPVESISAVAAPQTQIQRGDLINSSRGFVVPVQQHAPARFQSTYVRNLSSVKAGSISPVGSVATHPPQVRRADSINSQESFAVSAHDHTKTKMQATDVRNLSEVKTGSISPVRPVASASAVPGASQTNQIQRGNAETSSTGLPMEIINAPNTQTSVENEADSSFFFVKINQPGTGPTGEEASSSLSTLIKMMDIPNTKPSEKQVTETPNDDKFGSTHTSNEETKTFRELSWDEVITELLADESNISYDKFLESETDSEQTSALRKVVQEEVEKIEHICYDIKAEVIETNDDMTAIAAATQENGVVVVKLWHPATNMSQYIKQQFQSFQVAPIAPLYFVILKDYPSSSPVLKEAHNKPGDDTKSLQTKAMEKFKKLLKDQESHESPISLTDVARIFDRSVQDALVAHSRELRRQNMIKVFGEWHKASR